MSEASAAKTVLTLCKGGTLHSLVHGAGSKMRASEITVDQRLQAVAETVSGVAYLNKK